MRRGNKASDVVAHLARFGIPGLRSEDQGANLLQKANDLTVGPYMLATRETLQVVMWLKRACEAIFEEKKETGPTEGAKPHA